MLNENDLENILDLVDLGKMTIEEANIELVKSARFKIANKLPKQIRKFLNGAVKRGELGHLKKDGLKPEMYYYVGFEHLANAERLRIEREAQRNINKILFNIDDDITFNYNEYLKK